MPKLNLDIEYSAAQHHILFESEALAKYRIFPKGRRLGITRGAAHAFIEWMLQGDTMLWGDTINANIDRYVERYFQPVLKQHRIPYDWNQTKRVMKIGRGLTDFRSADKPENWEGFGYKRVFLNEAGIILKDAYLFENAVLPMLLDYHDSTLIAAGTPKGRTGLYFELWQRCERKAPGYYGRRYSSYDNPWLSKADIDELTETITQEVQAQEIYGEFIERGASVFKGVYYYDEGELPHNGYREATGADFAYTAKTSADYSVAIKGRKSGRTLYLTDFYREQIEAPAFGGILKTFRAPVTAYIGGTEKGVMQLLESELGISINAIPAQRDKYARAQPVAAAWNRGDVRLPKDAPWLEDFIDEVLSFTGVHDFHDDIVDALAGLWAAFDENESTATDVLAAMRGARLASARQRGRRQ